VAVHCPHIDAVQVQGGCYYCCKLVGHLIRDSSGMDGHDGSLTTEQEHFVGVIDPHVSGATWITITHPLTQMMAKEPIMPWERLVEAGEPPARNEKAQEVERLTARGLSRNEIAEQLDITPHAVSGYRSSYLSKE
jgi:DNA-binding NarL/FixJ family response regulator